MVFLPIYVETIQKAVQFRNVYELLDGLSRKFAVSEKSFRFSGLFA